MNFHQRNNRQRGLGGKRIFLAFIVVVVALFGLNYFFSGVVAQVARTPLVALAGTTSALKDSVTTMSNVRVQKITLQKEQELLKKRIRELELYALNNLVLVSENEELRRLLGDGATQINNGILAQVLSSGGLYPYGTILISRGAFEVGALVYGEQNIFLGTVAQVDKNTAVVQLVSGLSSKTDVIVGISPRATQATMYGRGNGNMIIEVPRDIDVRLDDPVVVAGALTTLVGFVGDIEVQSTDAFQIVRVRTPLNIKTVRFVRVH